MESEVQSRSSGEDIALRAAGDSIGEADCVV